MNRPDRRTNLVCVLLVFVIIAILVNTYYTSIEFRGKLTLLTYRVEVIIFPSDIVNVRTAKIICKESPKITDESIKKCKGTDGLLSLDEAMNCSQAVSVTSSIKIQKVITKFMFVPIKFSMQYESPMKDNCSCIHIANGDGYCI